jgi:eukaryotic-like serine/threonine-protein kinase
MLPFRGESTGVIFKTILDTTPTAAMRLNPELPEELERMINRALEKDRNLRYQHASEMRSELQRLKRDTDLRKSNAPGIALVARKRQKFWLAGVAVTVVTAVLAGYFVFHHPAKLTEKDTIVVADFTNTTGDSVFDDTLRRGLSVQLEQSPFLSIVSDQQIQRTLEMMGRKPDARLTPEIGRELCQRTGSAAVLDGSIAQIGTQYLLTLKAVNCVSGESLASAEAQASDKSPVLDALGNTASEIRNNLGESLSTVQKCWKPSILSA